MMTNSSAKPISHLIIKPNLTQLSVSLSVSVSHYPIFHLLICICSNQSQSQQYLSHQIYNLSVLKGSVSKSVSIYLINLSIRIYQINISVRTCPCSQVKSNQIQNLAISSQVQAQDSRLQIVDSVLPAALPQQQPIIQVNKTQGSGIILGSFSVPKSCYSYLPQALGPQVYALCPY